jgi:hypothetical protein
MPLPTQTAPQYELILPSNKKKVKFRPFFVGEEKILILALETRELSQISRAIKQVLDNCIITRGIKVEELPAFDIEYLFLQIRSKSIGESIELIITCGDDGKTEVPVTIFVDQIKVVVPDNHSSTIDLENGYNIQMKYPSLLQFIENTFELDRTSVANVEKNLKLVSSCIDTVYNTEECWSASDCTEDELLSYIEKLTPHQYKKLEQFFETMPKLSLKLQVKNPNTEIVNDVVLEGLNDFFA